MFPTARSTLQPLYLPGLCIGSSLCLSFGLTNTYAAIETQIKYHLHLAAFPDSSRKSYRKAYRKTSESKKSSLLSEDLQPPGSYFYFAMTHPVTGRCLPFDGKPQGQLYLLSVFPSQPLPVLPPLCLYAPPGHTAFFLLLELGQATSLVKAVTWALHRMLYTHIHTHKKPSCARCYSWCLIQSSGLRLNVTSSWRHSLISQARLNATPPLTTYSHGILYFLP